MKSIWLTSASETAGFDLRGPADDEGDAGAAFVNLVFPAAIGAGTVVALIDFFGRGVDLGAIVVAVVIDRTVVAGEDDEGVFGESVFVEGLEEFADGPVELRPSNRRGGRGRSCLGNGVRRARDVDVLGGVVEEERFGLVAFLQAMPSSG